MGYYTTAEIVKIVNKLIDRCGTRDPYKVAKELGINVIYRNFDKFYNPTPMFALKAVKE